MPTMIEEKPEAKTFRDTPERFKTAAATLFMDRFMTHFIKVGGVGIIAAVIAIFVFIFSQTLPLFSGAKVEPLAAYQLPPHTYQELGVDEWGELPFAVDSEGVLHFVRLKNTEEMKSVIPAASHPEVKISSFHYNAARQEMTYGTDDGRFFSLAVAYETVYENGANRIEVTTEESDLYEIGTPGAPVREIASGESDDRKLIAAIQKTESGYTVGTASLSRKRSLFGEGEFELEQRFDLTDKITGIPERILVNSHADALVVSTSEGKVFYFTIRGHRVTLRQSFLPFLGTDKILIASMDYLFGEVSLVFTNPDGINRIYSLLIPEGERYRIYRFTKEFDELPEAASFYDASLRNKAFLIGTGSFASLRYATTESVRWQQELPFEIRQAVIGGKYDRLLFLDTQSRLHVYRLVDHHPEAGFKAFFGKVWYEGYSQPSYDWQSTGGTDDFEPKLSLVPLIIGTLKGTFYAMIFALPIALLAALYTAQFAHQGFKTMVKPAMEIMASLPSVVLGFLAALWLAPAIESRVPSLIVIVVTLPLIVLAAGWAWTSLPVRYRKWIRPGYEWITLIPVVLAVCYGGWHLGPHLEKIFFVVRDPGSGLLYADFRLWWPQVTGTPFEQRNSLVVGFMMGFAVIPIIFTIAEDSLSNVPQTLSSASLALGASRWQTALRVVVPTAYPGIFSGVMIGLGRAIGETMIVVMATGNTPIMDFNIFSGMRTLSANIAVEIPEAPYLGTLYRTLFLGAVVLFLMTFVMNTGAEIIRQRLREKYRTV